MIFTVRWIPKNCRTCKRNTSSKPSFLVSMSKFEFLAALGLGFVFQSIESQPPKAGALGSKISGWRWSNEIKWSVNGSSSAFCSNQKNIWPCSSKLADCFSLLRIIGRKAVEPFNTSETMMCDVYTRRFTRVWCKSNTYIYIYSWRELKQIAQAILPLSTTSSEKGAPNDAAAGRRRTPCLQTVWASRRFGSHHSENLSIP